MKNKGKMINFNDFIGQAGVILVNNACDFDINKWEEDTAKEEDYDLDDSEISVKHKSDLLKYKLENNHIKQIIAKLKRGDFSFVDYGWYKHFLKNNYLTKDDLVEILKNLDSKEYKTVDDKKENNLSIIIKTIKKHLSCYIKLFIKLDIDVYEETPVLVVSILFDSKENQNKIETDNKNAFTQQKMKKIIDNLNKSQIKLFNGKPRDPKRIPTILRAIERIWLKNTDMRLGQMLESAATINKVDIFYVEDETLIAYLNRLFNKEETNNGKHKES